MTRMGVVSDGGDATPNPVQTRDAVTLIGILALIEGALLEGSVTDHGQGSFVIGSLRRESWCRSPRLGTFARRSTTSTIG
jgi:hypothetical protein